MNKRIQVVFSFVPIPIRVSIFFYLGCDMNILG
jgi:hypothetical protein